MDTLIGWICNLNLAKVLIAKQHCELRSDDGLVTCYKVMNHKMNSNVVSKPDQLVYLTTDFIIQQIIWDDDVMDLKFYKLFISKYAVTSLFTVLN